MVTPSRDVEGLTVACPDLRSAAGAIGAGAIDVKLVKCWYQDGAGWTPGGAQTIEGKVLVPELLVNDDDLVRVDLEKERNLLRVADPETGRGRYEDATEGNEALTRALVIRDAPALLPVDIPAGQVRQFWVTVHVPADAGAGTYEGEIRVRCEALPGVPDRAGGIALEEPAAPRSRLDRRYPVEEARLHCPRRGRRRLSRPPSAPDGDRRQAVAVHLLRHPDWLSQE